MVPQFTTSEQSLVPTLKPEWREEHNRTGDETDACSAVVFSDGLCTTEFITDPEWVIFHDLLQRWHSERRATRSVVEMVTCPSYQRIIAMGEPAIPLILSQLRTEGDEPDHWFWALRILTGIDPVRQEDQGDIVRMAEAWMQWGVDEGYVW